MTLDITAAASVGTNAFVASALKHAVASSASTASDNVAKVQADAVAANTILLTKLTTKAAVNAEVANEQQTRTEDLGESHLGTIFSVKA
jgi:hypothetical protein